MLPSTGILLIAAPTLLDMNFKRAVVFLAQHGEGGTLGYVLNRQLKATLSEIVPDLYGFDAPLYWGGPCQNDTLHCIHNVGTHIPGAAEITDGVFWGGDFEAIRDLIIAGAAVPNDFRFFIGYAGWGEGQLDDEIEEKSWILSESSPDAVFMDSAKNFWTRTLKNMGGEYRVLADTPEHPSLN
jgi:putative transcriptional regulator